MDFQIHYLLCSNSCGVIGVQCTYCDLSSSTERGLCLLIFISTRVIFFTLFRINRPVLSMLPAVDSLRVSLAARLCALVSAWINSAETSANEMTCS